MQTKYSEVLVGFKLDKSGRFPSGTVTKVEHWTARGGDTEQRQSNNGEMYRLTLDNGDVWYGWSDRTVKVIEN